MDSLLVEALVDTRHALDDLAGVAAAKPLRLRRELIEQAVARIDLDVTPPSHVARVAMMCVATRDEAIAMRNAHRVVTEALLEAMD